MQAIYFCGNVSSFLHEAGGMFEEYCLETDADPDEEIAHSLFVQQKQYTTTGYDMCQISSMHLSPLIKINVCSTQAHSTSNRTAACLMFIFWRASCFVYCNVVFDCYINNGLRCTVVGY